MSAAETHTHTLTQTLTAIATAIVTDTSGTGTPLLSQNSNVSKNRILGLLGLLRHRFVTNLIEPLKSLDTKSWLRIVIIVGGYLLLRPYLVRMGSKSSMRNFEAAGADGSELGPKERKKKGQRDLRELVDIPDDTESEGEDDAGGKLYGAAKVREGGGGGGVKGASSTSAVKASDWGAKARRRQRRVVRQILEAEEKRIQDILGDDEDKDIADLLED